MISQRRKIYDSFVAHGPCVCSEVASYLGLTPEQVRRGASNLIAMGCLVNLAPGSQRSVFAVVPSGKPPSHSGKSPTGPRKHPPEAPKLDACLLAQCLGYPS